MKKSFIFQRIGEQSARLRCAEGNVAVLFALLLVPMLGVVGLVVDYGQLMVAKSSAQMAADASSLYASGVAKELIRKSDGSTASVTNAFLEAKTRAEKLFQAQIGPMNVETYTAAVELERKDQLINATTNFTVKVATTLGNLFGVSSLSVTGMTAASASLPGYVDVYMALDVSQSMGLASTEAGAKALFAKTKALEKEGWANAPNLTKKQRDDGANAAKGCVFGCHVAQNGSKVAKTYQQVAADIGVPLRINVLESSVQKTINTAAANSIGAATYRIGLYTMGLNSSSGKTWALTELTPPSNNYSSVRTAASSINLGPNNSGGTGDTFLNEPLIELSKKMAVSGNGSSQSLARQYAIIITDGVRDIYGAGCTSGHCMATIDPAACKTLKDKGVTVGVIYTTYLPILEDPTRDNIDPNTKEQKLQGDYVNLVKPLANNIASKLKLCATSVDWFAEASDGPAIDAALTRMFYQTTQQAVLTN